MTCKPQPWYTAFNLPAWSPKNGRNRKPNPPTHRRSTDRASDSAGADDTADSFDYANWAHRTISIFEPSPPPAIPYAGVRAGEIIGYRMWLITQHYELCSLAHLFIWEPEAVVEGAVDEVVVKMFPFGKSIYGGTYSYANYRLLFDEMHSTMPGYSFPQPVMFNDCTKAILVLGIAIGTIKCWGEVVEHEKGYRAQYAKLQSIDQVIGNVDIETLRRKYNV